MKVNYVCQKSTGDWSAQFSAAVLAGMAENNIEVHEVDLTLLPYNMIKQAVIDAPPCDLWYFQRQHDWALPYVLDIRDEPAAAHCHGGIETRQFIDVVMNSPTTGGIIDFSEWTPRLSFMTVNTESHKAQIQDAYENMPPIKVTGFPIDMDDYPDHTRYMKKYIVVPGRFSPEKQQAMILSEALRPFKDRVVFSTGQDLDTRSSGGEVYKYLVRTGYAVVPYCKAKEFTDLLCQAKVVVTGGLADTLNVSLIEGVICGANPVAPGCTPYYEYLDQFFYRPSLIEEIQQCVQDALFAPHSLQRVEKYEKSAVAQRMASVFHEYTQAQGVKQEIE